MKHNFANRWLWTLWATLALSPAAHAESTFAQRLLNEGKYAEAEEAFNALVEASPIDAARGVARCQEFTGHREQAAQTLATALARQPDAAPLHAELARLALDRGDLAAALQSTEAALKLDPQLPPALWIRAQLHTAAGQLDQANTIHQQLVELFNQQQVKDADTLRWIGLGAAQYARWNRLSDQFKFLVNDFYPDLLALDRTAWQAHYEAGLLFAEKYNAVDAGKELRQALTINPNAAEVHAALGQQALESFEVDQARAACDRALEINPELLAAWHLKADIALANFDPRVAALALVDAQKLNPISAATLGRVAAVYLATDGATRIGDDTRFGKLVAQVNARNPHAGDFYEALADALDRLRRWPASANYYQQALDRMPQSLSVPGKLGMILMRLAEEERAKDVLDKSFADDPFNVRVNNTLKVLEVLAGYGTHETEHFVIRYDPAKDTVLAHAMGAWLEEVYPQLVKQMGYAPRGKSLFEIFCKAKNTDGHGWFSARMVGLPNIHPIGACAGRIVALQSPSEGQRFNWARVLKHEFIHLINLEQTDFNVPHWFTEALAVLNEGYPRSEQWNDLLAARAARGKLFDLDTINLGFIRPQSSDEWTLAYCQAEMYAEYMLERFGEDAIAKMLSAYADNLTTPEAIHRSFGQSQPEFEQGYQAYVAKVVRELPKSDSQREMDLAEVQRAVIQSPQDSSALAQLARAHLDRRSYPDARRAADQALAIDPKNGLAHYVRARLHLVVGEDVEALARLEAGLDREHPQENLISLLAGLKLRSEEFAAAAELYELGAKHDPGHAKWLKSLSSVYLKSGDDKQLAATLARLAQADADDLPVRKKLAQLSMAVGDMPSAARWAKEALQFDIGDVQMHTWRAEALAETGDLAGAATSYALALELEPDEPARRLALAKIFVRASNFAQARSVLDELEKRQPDFPGAKAVRESLK